jgi:hypothetical protein
MEAVVTLPEVLFRNFPQQSDEKNEKLVTVNVVAEFHITHLPITSQNNG